MISINTILLIIAAIAGVFGVGFLKGKSDEKINQIKGERDIYEKAKDTRTKVDKMSGTELDSTIDKLYDKGK